MPSFGYKLVEEEHAPRALVENAVRAEAAVGISDHSFPWFEAQGHSPFAWGVLGALAQATDRLGLMTAVTCPTLRYHGAIAARATATTSSLSGGHFTLGLGCGERLDEHVVGGGWPDVSVRLETCEEALDLLRLLFEGGTQSHRGARLALEDGRLADRPERPVPIVVAAAKADGLVATEPERPLVEAFEQAGGRGPRCAGCAGFRAASETKATEIARRFARWSGRGWNLMPELPDPEAFEEASKSVRPEDVAGSMPLGPDVARNVAAVRSHLEAGFDHVVLVHIGPEQDGFLRFCEHELRPALEELVQ